MAIFNSYVTLPEGISSNLPSLGTCLSHLPGDLQGPLSSQDFQRVLSGGPLWLLVLGGKLRIPWENRGCDGDMMGKWVCICTYVCM